MKEYGCSRQLKFRCFEVVLGKHLKVSTHILQFDPRRLQEFVIDVIGLQRIQRTGKGQHGAVVALQQVHRHPRLKTLVHAYELCIDTRRIKCIDNKLTEGIIANPPRTATFNPSFAA